MAYTPPSVQVTQTLTTSGGVADTTPDLNAVIVGPLFNVIKADLDDVIASARSQALTNFNWQTRFATNTSVGLPNFVAGQRLVASSIRIAVSNAYVKINEFTASLAFAAGLADPIARSKVTVSVIANTSPKFAFNTTAPDAALNLQVGDRLVYTATTTGPVTTTYTTSVRSIDLTGAAPIITISNAIPESVLASNTAVVFTVFRQYDALNIPLGAPASNVVGTQIADSAYTVSFPQNLSAFPTATQGSFYTLMDVGALYIGYNALRTDLSQTVVSLTASNYDSVLGSPSVDNPLSLAVSVALANTTGIIKALSLETNDAAGYLQALDVLDSDNTVYALCPLTQDVSIHAAFKAHVNSMSTPIQAAWRVAVVNTPIAATANIGTATPALPGSASVRQLVVNSVNYTYLIDPETDFMANGVVGTDLVTISAIGAGTLPQGTTSADFLGTWTVVNVIDANTLQIVSTNPSYVFRYTGGTPNISSAQVASFYITRNLTQDAQAARVAATSTTFGDKRIIHTQPDSVSVSVGGTNVAGLPGYYLSAALAGAISGYPVQQGFTNLTIAGITDLQNSNYYFRRDNLNIMAGAGTCLFVQAVQGGVPFCRHELTTDMSTLEYREILKVKNWDFLSYYVKNLLTPYLGQWNILEDTLNTIRATIIAGMDLLIGKKLPKIGAPLLDYTIVTLEQSAVNKDRIKIKIRIAIVDPTNYIDVDLEI